MNIPESILQQQYASSNPENSSWVSANAGSGKTHVLTQRVIRLMLDGNSPDRILCLTFTKAAAANMKNRVFDTLAEWTMMADKELHKAIQKTSNKHSSTKLRRRARQLFALALDTPGGLKIQTIHAFCESLLHQFPLEANVPGHFETLQEIEQANLLAQARAQVLSGEGSTAAQHYAALVPYATDSTIEEGLNAIIAIRHEFVNRRIENGEAAHNSLYEKLGISPRDTAQGIKQFVLDEILKSHDLIKSMCALADASTAVTDGKLLGILQKLMENPQAEDIFDALQKHLLTKDTKTKGLKQKADSSIATKQISSDLPASLPILHDWAEYILTALEKINAIQLLANSNHLFQIGEAILERYESMKRQRGIIDFDDQIEKTAALLTRADIRDWIRYRLDRGIDHLLVDEAQDTSPKQWEIINAVTDDFHAGENAAHTNRTIFVVGDEKQSIFSFQGAAPSEFDRQRRELKKRVETASRKFHAGQLELSFRSTQDVLHAVDKVFENDENACGLTQSGIKPVHDAVRSNHPGEVQVWPLFVQEKVLQTESWLDPVDKKAADDPAVLLAERIADSIGQWVDKPLPGMDKPLKFGDILVLVRKRDRFLTAFTRTMKDKGLAIAGADRLTLTDHIAVEDLIAMGRVALLPQDDLSLACVLKGVFFNHDEDTLYEFSHARGEISLYQRIIQIAGDENHPLTAIAQTTFEKLEAIITLGSQLSVFDFYACLLGKMQGRRKFLSRLGAEAEDVLDAFLDEALTFTNERNGGLETFITELIKAQPVIKREVELDRDEVRVLTVHSSKGLEAKLVFLVDHCGPAWTEKHRPPLLEVENEPFQNSYLWLASSDQHIEATRKSSALIGEAAEAEYRRLLYVGMTRAADRLVVCGYHGVGEKKHAYWHKMVHQALVDTSTEIHNDAGEIIVWKWISKNQPAIAQKDSANDKNREDAQPIFPDWLLLPAQSDPPLPRPLTPSGAHALIDKESLINENLKFDTDIQQGSFALQKGNAMHKLLEVLPDIAPQNRETLARDYLDKTCADWTQSQRENLLESVLAIFSHPSFTNLFEGQSRAEVSLAGRLDIKSGSMLVTGQIDRLIVSEQHITILDYKTNRSVPESLPEVPEEYITQLALYRDLVARVYPGKNIISALLWTQTPQLMEIPQPMLDGALQKIKNG